MSKSRSRPDIDTLLADRAKYEAWLDQIEAKASRVPGHVVERVRADYHERLTEVVNELRTRADDLRTEGNELEARIAVLDGELGGKRDARAEDELRALVGEYDETAWSEKAAEHDASIGTLETERSAREADLNRVRQLLGEATRPSRAMRAISEAEIPEEPTPAAPAIEVVAADAEGPVEVVAEAPSPSSAPAEPEVAVGLQAEPVLLAEVLDQAVGQGALAHPGGAGDADDVGPAAMGIELY